jgi:hypothetical protein
MRIDPLLPAWLIAVLLTLLLVLFFFLEWRRVLRFRALRLTSVIVMAASLGAILLRPHYPVTGHDTAVLLTSGFSRTVADSLLRSGGHPVLLQLGMEKGYRNARGLSSYRALMQRPESVTAILGEGLPSYALESIEAPFAFFPSPAPEGITACTFPMDGAERNKEQVVSGSYRVKQGPATIYLESPAGRIDSIKVPATEGNFRFRFMPRTSGRNIYYVAVSDTTGTVAREKFPLHIRPFRPLNVLIIQGYPTFETQQLGNFLSDRGHHVAARTQLSRKVYRTAFANREAIGLNPLTGPLLDNFDLLLIDPGSVTTLAPAERASVAAALRNGLGVVVLFNMIPTKPVDSDILPIAFGQVPVDTAVVRIHEKAYTLPATRLSPRSNNLVPISGTTKRTLSGYTPVRQGKAAFQLLQGTYALQLAGDSIAYGALWSPLIDAVARRPSGGSAIRLESKFPYYANEPMAIEVVSEDIPLLYADSTRIPVQEDALIDGLWHATAWTDATGWHTLHTADDTTSYYVFNSGEWQALRVTQQHALNHAAGARTSMRASGPLSTLFPPLVFWLTFLAAAGFLWLAPKL